MIAHAEYLGPAVESEPMVHVRAVEITNLVPIANEREVTRPTTSLTVMTSTTHTTNHSPPQRAFLPPICQPPPSVPQLSSSSLNGMTQIRRTTVVPPAETIQPQTTKSCKHAKIIAGVVGGTVGLVTLGPLAAIGIGLASALLSCSC